jgi:hypothetical protein
MASIIFSLFLIEGLLQVIDYPCRSNCLYFVTPKSLKDQKIHFGFYENTQIRMVSVCKNSKDWQIEFDNTFETNNLGLVQQSYVNPKKKSIVIIGDSFIQGVGVTPWFYEFEKNWLNNEYQVVNLGIIGTGMIQWHDTLEWFGKFGQIEHIIICFISTDWIRQRWHAQEFPDRLLLINAANNHKSFEYYLINNKTDQYKLLTITKGIISNSIMSIIYNWLKSIKIALLAHNWYLQYKNNEVFEVSVVSLDKIISQYGAKNITFLHIPEYNEIINNKYNITGKRAKETILARNLSYIDGLACCGLTKEDYLIIDGHPNKSGYSKILSCLQKYMKNISF